MEPKTLKNMEEN